MQKPLEMLRMWNQIMFDITFAKEKKMRQLYLHFFTIFL